MRKPRRVRRRLLLPPGWVALGFLLLLGCSTLVPRWRELRLNNVLQITMPPLPAGKLGLWPELFHQSPKQLEKYRPWHTVDLNCELIPDFFGTAAAEAATRQIIADTSHAGGVRIRFWPGTTYAGLISVLDIMNRVNQKKYWLDIQHSPTTLYAITDPPTRTKPVVLFSCGTRYFEARMPPLKVSFRDILEDFWRNLQALASQPWQASTLLLVIISGLSLWRLSRPKINRIYF